MMGFFRGWNWKIGVRPFPFPRGTERAKGDRDGIDTAGCEGRETIPSVDPCGTDRLRSDEWTTPGHGRFSSRSLERSGIGQIRPDRQDRCGLQNTRVPPRSQPNRLLGDEPTRSLARWMKRIAYCPTRRIECEPILEDLSERSETVLRLTELRKAWRLDAGLQNIQSKLLARRTSTQGSGSLLKPRNSLPLTRGLTLPAILLAALVLTPAAHAEFGIVPGSAIAKAHELVTLAQSECIVAVTGSCPFPPEERIVNLSAIRAAQPFAQAGAHPDATGAGQLSDTERFNPKDVFVETPPGFIGNITSVPACSRAAFLKFLRGMEGITPTANGCSPASQVGVATTWFSGAVSPPGSRWTSPVYRLTASPGYPASFGFDVDNAGIVVNGNVRTGGDYGVTLGSTNITDFVTLEATAVTLWGDPGDPIHDAERWNPGGEYVAEKGEIRYGEWGLSPQLSEIPFLQTPADCNAKRLIGTVAIDSWQEPGRFLPEEPFNPLYAVPEPTPTGCEHLAFKPWIGLLPSDTNSDSPTGVSVQLEVPQNQAPEGFSTPELKRAVTTLPEGMSINPAAADGLQGCTSQQIGLKTTHGAYPNPIRFEEGLANCPRASKIGSAELQTPLLEETLEGSVYVATPYDNPFHSLYAVYLVVNGPGFTVKLPGKVEPNPVTGQLETTFEYLPQLPFEHLKLNFFGGPRGPLATPRTCGIKAITTELEPWSAPQSGPPATPSNQYTASEGPNGAACSASLATRPFSPSLLAGTENPIAGATTGFELQLKREDGNQEIDTVTAKMPPGLTAYIRNVPYCSEQAIAVAATRSGEYEAAHPDCPAVSQVGRLIAGVGAGPTPYHIEGRVYLAGPYRGAPLSLVTITPALAGGTPGHPLFDLGTVVVRVAVFIDKKTAQVTAVSDPIPQILDGIPLRLREVEVILDRPGFMRNPTSCAPMKIEAQASGQSGASASLSNRFQVAGCASLPFKPTFSALTHAGHTRRNGEYLRVAVTSSKSQAAIREVHVELPKKLPSRIETLQKACFAKTFEENPAACPAASVVGTAIVRTPVLPVSLRGPAYFVSYGGAKFPELVMVLQGDGITIGLNGETFISKKSITSSTFHSVPDVPFSRFELTLPAGRYSALAGNGNMCKQPLRMPVRMVAQSGKVFEQDTRLTVAGCGRRHARKAAHGHKHRR